MAGKSARDQAQRRRTAAERELRRAELWERGAVGEETTAAALALLPPDEWTTFHDLRWPGRQRANIDHVVVGPPGVFVIDTKNWSGPIVVRDGVLRQRGRSRDRSVAGVVDAARAVAAVLRGGGDQSVLPVLCFVGDAPPPGWVREVMIADSATLVEMLRSRPARLSPERLREICLELDAVTRTALAAPHQTGLAPTPATQRLALPNASADVGRRVVAGASLRPSRGTASRPFSRGRSLPWPRLLGVIAVAIAGLALLPDVARLVADRVVVTAAAPLPAEPTVPADLTGRWRGDVDCGDGVIRVIVRVSAPDGGSDRQATTVSARSSAGALSIPGSISDQRAGARFEARVGGITMDLLPSGEDLVRASFVGAAVAPCPEFALRRG
ncbi:nuclease-related domain-containing protein [Nocardioides sp. R-C-SC26]|uniref:nuclease-related domain-containing protein n=1 Tax=Nocardioides sp. R-C-SC26 TaxID=2870414 RepID=UPI001E5F327A|nr:nuclease-related domain-containing protein [Nocardioides sp. R-C-SC26]